MLAGAVILIMKQATAKWTEFIHDSIARSPRHFTATVADDHEDQSETEFAGRACAGLNFTFTLQ